MSDNEDDESWQLIQELRETITELRSDKSDLQDDLDEVRSELRDEKEEKEELQEELDILKQTAWLWDDFSEAFEYYSTIWNDDTKDQQLITRMKELYGKHISSKKV